MFRDDEFAKQVIAITGAGRGFGLAMAYAFAEHGAIPVILELDHDRGEDAVHALQAAGHEASFFQLDVRDETAVTGTVKQIIQRYGRLDVWINNAGLAFHGPSESVTAESWRLCIDVMLSGTFFGAQAAGKVMLERGTGCIINIASVNGLMAQAGRAAYCAAKAGVIRLTEVLAAEWGGRGVRVNAVAPAVFMTELARTSIADGAASLQVYLDRSPTGRLGELPELVHTILFAASNRAGYINGQTFRVDGAWVSDHGL